MGRTPKSRPSFFKVKDFTCHLRLPPVFVRKYGGILPENTKLRTSSGGTWNVILEQVDEEKYCFTRGWTKFAADVGVKMGEFLVFWFSIGKSTFDVSVFGINGCERKISARTSQVEGSDSDEDVELRKYCTCVHPVAPEVNKNQSMAYSVENEAGSDDGTQKYDYTSEEAHPHFKLLLKEHHRSRVSLRKEFAVAAGIMSEEAVVLQYHPRQRCWPVLLCHYPNLSQFRLDLAGGWNGFRRTNGLAFGKTYLFEYIPDKNVIMVKLLSSEN